MSHAIATVSVVLAAEGPDPEDVTAGWAGFLVFLGLAVAVVLLWLSFRKQLKKIDFEEEPDAPASRDDADEADPPGPPDDAPRPPEPPER